MAGCICGYEKKEIIFRHVLSGDVPSKASICRVVVVPTLEVEIMKFMPLAFSHELVWWKHIRQHEML